MGKKIKDLNVVSTTNDTKIPCSGGATTLGTILPSGVIQMYAGNTAPNGWAMCDGAELPIASHPSLFRVIGNTFGGDGVYNFALPNLTRRFPFGAGGRGLGEVGGKSYVTLTTENLPSHNHPVTLTGGQVSINVTAIATLNGVTASGNFPATPVPVTGGEVTIPVNSNVRGVDLFNPSQGVLAPTAYPSYKSQSDGTHYKEKGSLIGAVANIPQTPLELPVSGSVSVPIQTTADVTGGSATASSTGNGEPVDIMNPFLALNFIIRL